MMKRNMLKVLAPLSLLVLAACSEPIVGSWEVEEGNQCGETEFNVDDDLRGDGTLHIVGVDGDGDLTCLECDFEIEVTAKDDGSYEAEIEFDKCACPSASGNGRKAEAECTLSDDENELECEIEWGECIDSDEEETFERRA